MNRRLYGIAAAGLLAAACASDPTSDLSGDPVRVIASLDVMSLVAGDSVLVTAESRTAQGVTHPTLPTPASTNTGVATTSDATVPPLSVARFYIKGVAAGDAFVVLTAGVAVDTITVTVN